MSVTRPNDTDNDNDHDHDKDCKGGCNIVINCGGKPGPHPKQPNEYAEIYSQMSQTLSASTGPNLPGQVILLENLIVATSNIDTSTAAVDGKIKINLTGWYDVATGICASLNPIPNPLPVWTMSLFRNGILIPGSTFANVPLSPTQVSNEIVADVYVHFKKGDVLTLNNTSTNVVFLSAPTLGSNAQPNSAYMKIALLEAI